MYLMMRGGDRKGGEQGIGTKGYKYMYMFM